MAGRMFSRLRKVRRLFAVVVICTLAMNGAAWGGLQRPLSEVPVPEPPNLSLFVKDKAAAIRLGKALFWDMQAGSDGVTACASCHYRAGADPVVGTAPKAFARRDRNQLHPGPDTIFGNNSTVIRTFVTNLITGLDEPFNLRAADRLASGRQPFGPNYTLQPFVDFPLFRVLPETSRLVIDPLTGFTGDAVTLLWDTNDVVGSQGVRLAQFAGIDPNSDQDFSTPLADPLFSLNGANIRQVTGRNTPPVVNAVFNYTNFWDGRANNIFNGVNPLGPLDQGAGIWIDNGSALEKQQVAIRNASLASQAVGPPLSDVEMSFRGRTFPELGRKMLRLTPLGKQLVHPDDSVFSVPVQLSRATLNGDGTVTGTPGLSTDYSAMVKAAFQDYLWDSGKSVTLPATVGGVTTTDDFTQMEANFSLFWGLAIQLYEATLVSDRTPFDRFQAGNQNALSAAAQRGLATFDSKCTVCHSGTEFTAAAAGSNIPCVAPDCNHPVFTNNTTHTLIRQEVNPTTFAVNLTDAGFFNIGVRPTADSQGRGAGEPDFPFPLSFTRLAKLAAQGSLPFVTPGLPFGVAATAPDIVNGTFKAPGLRNVELTPPYFHNGDALTLNQVVDFYTRGGDFPDNPQLAAAMQPIGKLRGDAVGRLEVAEFLTTLTDDRVRNEWAPFDHPELQIPNGVDEVGADIMITLPATGGGPAPVPPSLLTLNPVITPTLQSTQLLTGTVDSTATVAVSVNNGTPIFANIPCIIDPITAACTTDTPAASDWSVTVTGLVVGHNSIAVTATSPTGAALSAPVADIQVMPSATISGIPPGGRTTQTSVSLTIGGAGVVSYQYRLDGGPVVVVDSVATPINLSALSDGTHSVVVLGKDAAGNQQPAALPTTGIWTVKANPPVLTLNQLDSPMGRKPLIIGGTVELGSTPTVSVDTGATAACAAPIPLGGISTWSCTVSGLTQGVNNITVRAFDFLFNLSTVNGSVTVIFPDGNFKGTGNTDISDALKALRMAVGLEQPSTIDMLHGDVAPLVGGLPDPDNRIDIADALTILRKVVGLINF